MKQLLLAIIPLLLLATVSNVYAGGPRLDYPYPGTDEEADCWVDGYDAGFAGKYDKHRAKECLGDGGDSYNESWDGACRDGSYTENECADFINNPVVDLGDHEQLKEENTQACYDAGREDGESNKPFNKERDSGCAEFGDYGGGYQLGCETHTTQASCELLYKEKKYFCPDHPDIVACVEFLHNATNKQTGYPYGDPCSGMGNLTANVICPQEENPFTSRLMVTLLIMS